MNTQHTDISFRRMASIAGVSLVPHTATANAWLADEFEHVSGDLTEGQMRAIAARAQRAGLNVRFVEL